MVTSQREDHDALVPIDPGQDERGAFGDGLKVSFACPSCDHVGWVEWKNLSHGMGCRKCGCRFGIGRDGQLASLAQIALRYSCPRCGHGGWMPSALAVRGVECTACNLPLVRGPDNRLYSQEQYAEIKQNFVKPKPPEVFQKSTTSKQERARTKRMLIGSGAAVLAFVLAITLYFATRPTESVAAKFTHCCLAGKWDLAEKFIQEDDLQLEEFRRWRIRHFASIEESFRPRGDRVDVAVAVIAEEPAQKVFDITMTSPFVGVRQHEQCWRLEGDAWLFDAAATLARQDRTAQRTSGPEEILVPTSPSVAQVSEQ